MNEIRKRELVGYKGLAMAIVEQACEDYLHGVKVIKSLVLEKDKHINRWLKYDKARKYRKLNTQRKIDREYKHRIKCELSELESIESFFRSEFYRTICEADGEYIITKLKEKAIAKHGFDVETMKEVKPEN